MKAYIDEYRGNGSVVKNILQKNLLSMTKKIARKIRINPKKHGGNGNKVKIRKTNLNSNREPKKASPVISKLATPNHNRLLSKIKIRPWQTFIADVANLEIKATKGRKLMYLYFDKVSKVDIQKEIYSGRNKGVPPRQVVLHKSIEIPKIPGIYNLKGAQFKLDGKEGQVIITSTSFTEWQRLVA